MASKERDKAQTCFLRYDPGIPSVMPVAGGCLTMKKQCDARLFSHDAWLFLLTLVTFSYFFYWW
jgi:hypothetical protein